MSKIVSPVRHGAAFEADRTSRNVTRFLIVLQVTGLILVFCLRLLDFHFLALAVSILTLILFIASVFQLYSRYQNLPVIREKIRLERLHSKFEKNLRREKDVIHVAILERERLVQAEKAELEKATSTLQKDRIGQKYQSLQEQNSAAESRARASTELLARELILFKPRLRQLAPLTFPFFLSRTLAPHVLTAGMLAFAVVLMQMVSSVSALDTALKAALPPVTPSPAQMAVLASAVPPTVTNVPTLAFTATVAEVATQSSPPTGTAIPEDASTPLATLPVGLASCIPPDAPRETGLVVDVVDGDTIDVQIGDQVLRVRYIGVNTPEQDQPLYSEALAYNQTLVGNKTVTLVKDTSEVDDFNRLLRYVVTADTFVNQSLVEMGFAEASAYVPDTSCIGAFEAAQRQAQTAKVGLWLATPVVFIAPVTGGEVTAACDPSYPGVCIAPAPPDLDCGDIAFERFQVVSPDPHGFDRDQDGVGCE